MKSSEEQVGPKIFINDIELHNRSAHEIVEVLFLCIDFIYSPMEAIQANLAELFSTAREYLIDRKAYSSDKKDRAACSRLLRQISIWQVKWKRLSKVQLMNAYWDFILRNQNLALLPGFGVATNFGDVLRVNPEKTSLHSIVKT